MLYGKNNNNNNNNNTNNMRVPFTIAIIIQQHAWLKITTLIIMGNSLRTACLLLQGWLLLYNSRWTPGRKAGVEGGGSSRASFVLFWGVAARGLGFRGLGVLYLYPLGLQRSRCIQGSRCTASVSPNGTGWHPRHHTQGHASHAPLPALPPPCSPALPQP